MEDEDEKKVKGEETKPQADVVPQYYIMKTENDMQYVYNKVPSRTLRFMVKSSNDAHIQLSQTNDPSETDPVLVIFIGGAENQKSAIRRDCTPPDKAEVDTPGILSKEEFRGFWIKYHEGAITVGKENEVEPFLTWTDPAPINVVYFGVCTGYGATGEWVVDVASLQSASRDVILQHIQKLPVSSLPLPKILKDYLLYKPCIISSTDILSLVKGEETKPQADVVPQYYIMTVDWREYVYNKVPSRNFNLKFKVKCAHYARIRLSQTNIWTEPELEIYFGNMFNPMSGIYRDIYKDVVEVNTPGILSKEEFRGFWIKYHEGTITVGKENEVEPFLTCTDPEPINVAYFGVYSLAPGEWVVSVTGYVASLQSACRDVILQHIQKPRVSSLPLPKILKDYLLYET